jgi:hypothetical protein
LIVEFFAVLCSGETKKWLLHAWAQFKQGFIVQAVITNDHRRLIVAMFAVICSGGINK